MSENENNGVVKRVKTTFINSRVVSRIGSCEIYNETYRLSFKYGMPKLSRNCLL